MFGRFGLRGLSPISDYRGFPMVVFFLNLNFRGFRELKKTFSLLISRTLNIKYEDYANYYDENFTNKSSLPAHV